MNQKTNKNPIRSQSLIFPKMTVTKKNRQYHTVQNVKENVIIWILTIMKKQYRKISECTTAQAARGIFSRLRFRRMGIYTKHAIVLNQVISRVNLLTFIS